MHLSRTVPISVLPHSDPEMRFNAIGIIPEGLQLSAYRYITVAENDGESVSAIELEQQRHVLRPIRENVDVRKSSAWSPSIVSRKVDLRPVLLIQPSSVEWP